MNSGTAHFDNWLKRGRFQNPFAQDLPTTVSTAAGHRSARARDAISSAPFPRPHRSNRCERLLRFPEKARPAPAPAVCWRQPARGEKWKPDSICSSQVVARAVAPGTADSGIFSALAPARLTFFDRRRRFGARQFRQFRLRRPPAGVRKRIFWRIKFRQINALVLAIGGRFAVR